MSHTNNLSCHATPSVADQLAAQLAAALDQLGTLPLPGVTPPAVTHGVTAGGEFVGNMANVIAEIGDVLCPTGEDPRLFRLGTELVFERRDAGHDPQLVPLTAGTAPDPGASAVLANVLVCETRVKESVRQYPLPSKALAAVLASESFRKRVAVVEHYARRPVYSTAYVLLGPGYHAAERVLVHGPTVTPDLTPLPGDGPAVSRLPHHLRTLLGGFCFKADADVCNIVGLLLTGLLVNHFAGEKGVALIDGNQPGVGKSLLVRVVGVLQDGRDPRLIGYTPNDEELQKQICATLRGGGQSVVWIDNAKSANGTAVSSPTVEANSVAAEVSLRVLGTSTNYVRPNDLLWVLTMNQTRVSPDLVSRGLPVRLSFDGPPGKRTYPLADPVAYAREHRLAVLGELAGFVQRWTLAGRPPGPATHRCHQWAATVSGIMVANGLTEFLANADDAAGEFDAGVSELVDLASAAVGDTDGPWVLAGPSAAGPRAKPAADWAALFQTAEVDVGGLAKGGVARIYGKWLSARVGHSVPVSHGGHTGTATLRSGTGHAKERRYWFEIQLDGTSGPESPSAVDPTSTAIPASPPPPPSGGGNPLNWDDGG